jgi:hypothetical protein
VKGSTSTRMWVRTAGCLSVLFALALVASGSAGAVTISGWVGGKAATPDLVTATSVGCPGTVVFITGTGFVSDGGVTGVTIGGVPASEIIVGSDINLYARVGVGATSGSVVVTTKAGTATAATKAVVLACQSTGAAAVKPTIDSVTPTKAKAGKKIKLLGVGFVGLTSVKVGGVAAAYSVPTDNLMYIIVPSGTKPGQAAIDLTNTLGKTSSFVIVKSG